MDAEDIKLAPQVVMRDNDTKFTAQFDGVFTNNGAKINRNTPLSPNLRAHVDRFIQTLQVECLDKFVIVAGRLLNYVCRQFELLYNTECPHEACGYLPSAMVARPEPWLNVGRGDVTCNMRHGGR